jgi:hypothetical protein
MGPGRGRAKPHPGAESGNPLRLSQIGVTSFHHGRLKSQPW